MLRLERWFYIRGISCTMRSGVWITASLYQARCLLHTRDSGSIVGCVCLSVCLYIPVVFVSVWCLCVSLCLCTYISVLCMYVHVCVFTYVCVSCVCVCLSLCVCVGGDAYHSMSVDVKGQLSRVTPSLISCWSQRLNLGHQSWWQTPLSMESSFWP